MSVVATAASKGEKSKKFQSLDINNLYQGSSSKPQQKSAPHKHGLQSLGKVPTARRAPVNLPSLKAENSGNDPSVNIVPTGVSGWAGGSKDEPTSNPKDNNNSSEGNLKPQQPQQQQQQQPPPPRSSSHLQKPSKTWTSQLESSSSSSSSPPPKTAPFLPPQHLNLKQRLFQQNFPSLTGKPVSTPTNLEGGGDLTSDNKYGPGPSLRPQTFGNWSFGGGAVATKNESSQQPETRVSIASDHITSQPRPASDYHRQLQFDVSTKSPLIPHVGIIARKSTQDPVALKKGRGDNGGGGGGGGVGGGVAVFKQSIIANEQLRRMDDDKINDNDDNDWTKSDDTFDYNKKISSDAEEEETEQRINPNWADSINKPSSTEFLEDEEHRRRAKKNEEVLKNKERAKRRREEEESKYSERQRTVGYFRSRYGKFDVGNDDVSGRKSSPPPRFKRNGVQLQALKRNSPPKETPEALQTKKSEDRDDDDNDDVNIQHSSEEPCDQMEQSNNMITTPNEEEQQQNSEQQLDVGAVAKPKGHTDTSSTTETVEKEEEEQQQKQQQQQEEEEEEKEDLEVKMKNISLLPPGKVEESGWFAPRGQPSRRGRGGGIGRSMRQQFDELESDNKAKCGRGGAESSGNRYPPKRITNEDRNRNYPQGGLDKRQNKLPPRLAKQKEQNRLVPAAKIEWSGETTSSNDITYWDQNEVLNEAIQGGGGGGAAGDGLHNATAAASAVAAAAAETVQTIIFENTNFKGSGDKFKSLPDTGLPLGFKQDDLKLDFTSFETDGNKSNPHSADDLNQKIASVKKVWETMPETSGFNQTGFNEGRVPFGEKSETATNIAKVRPQQQVLQALRGGPEEEYNPMGSLTSPPVMNQPPALYQAFQLEHGGRGVAAANHMYPAAAFAPGLGGQSAVLLPSSGGGGGGGGVGGGGNTGDVFGPSGSQFRLQGAFANPPVQSKQTPSSIGAIGSCSKGGGGGGGYQQSGLGTLPTVSGTSPLHLISYDGSQAAGMNYNAAAAAAAAAAAVAMQRHGQTAFYQTLAASNPRQQNAFANGFGGQQLSVAQLRNAMPYPPTIKHEVGKNPRSGGESTFGGSSHMGHFTPQNGARGPPYSPTPIQRPPTQGNHL